MSHAAPGPLAPDTSMRVTGFRAQSIARTSVAPYKASCDAAPPKVASWRSRSEEHTSELQSLTNLVCRLLLEKKNERIVRPHDLVVFMHDRSRTAEPSLVTTLGAC